MKAFLGELTKLFEEMEKEALPTTRDEFEARAVLFYMMKQLEEFLTLKEKFMEKYQIKGENLGE